MEAYPCPLLQVLIDGLHQCCLGDCPDDGVHLLAPLEDHDSGDAPDSILRGYLWALIRVELEAPQLVLVLHSQLVDDGRYHAARPTPGSPEVQQHGHRALEHQLIKGVVIYWARGLRSRNVAQAPAPG